jgi:hypothetical protein
MAYIVEATKQTYNFSETCDMRLCCLMVGLGTLQVEG